MYTFYTSCNVHKIIRTYLFSTATKQDTSEADQTENASLPRTEVIKRLRERGHPILLYGENEFQSFKRLRRIEIQEPEANRVYHKCFIPLSIFLLEKNL